MRGRLACQLAFLQRAHGGQHGLAIRAAIRIGGAAVFVASFLLHLPALVGVWLAASGVLAVLLGELWLGLQFLGARFEKLDLSSELRP